MSDIEKDFQSVADQINAKIKEAGELIKQANALAKSVGVKCYAYPHCYTGDVKKLGELIDFDPIIGSLDQAGWQTSTMTADC